MSQISHSTVNIKRHPVAQLVEPLRCKPEGRGFDSDGVIGIFQWQNPSGRTMALGLIQPLTGMSTSNISWGVKAAGAYGWQPYHLHVPTVLKCGSLILLEPSGPVQTCNGIALSFIVNIRLTKDRQELKNNLQNTSFVHIYAHLWTFVHICAHLFAAQFRSISKSTKHKKCFKDRSHSQTTTSISII